MERKPSLNTQWGLALVSLCVLAVTAYAAVQPHVCDRECVKGAKPMTCHFNWTMEVFVVMSKQCLNCPFQSADCDRLQCIPANGVRRTITVLSRRMPGSPIVVCKDDRIVVDIHNEAGVDATTIHWHGVNQVGTPYMDGVPFVTQCPINPFNNFRYDFKAQEVGTYFYHSHLGFQRTDGVNGLLVVRQPKADDPNRDTYDFDLTAHQIMLTDWINKTGEDMLVEFYHTNEDYSNYLTTILVNGKGRLRPFQNATTGQVYYTPYSSFTVKRGNRYRFRVCSNANWICPIEISVDRHNLTVVGTDGDSVLPITVSRVVINPGERFDFVINANQPVGTYWMTFRGLLRCELGGAVGRAILKYETARDVEPPEPVGLSPDSLILNPVNDPFVNKSQISLTQLQSYTPRDKSLQVTPDQKYYIPFDLYPNLNPALSAPDSNSLLPMVNGTAFLFPPSPLLSQYNDIPKDILCTDSDRTKNCSAEFCQCTYYLKAKLNAVVELILIDIAPAWQVGANHPWHLHGHHFRVVGQDLMEFNNTVEAVKALDDAGQIKRNLDKPVMKDTVSVPHGGYSVLRFHAINPGFWAFHCHVEMHTETGMLLVIQVGELTDLPKPPANFPKCANFPKDANY